MGHDITAYVKTKADRDSESPGKEVAYFRIGAFDKIRQRLFYGILQRAESANAGVSGSGTTIRFTRDDIAKAIEACKYFMEDEDALRDVILSKQHSQEEVSQQFLDAIDSVFGPSPDRSRMMSTEATEEEYRAQLADIWEFLEDIISGYDHARSTDPSAQIRIEFF